MKSLFKHRHVLLLMLAGVTGMAGLWALDQDGGGISDPWETHWGTGPLNATEDLDSDGYSNLQEYYFNTNPLDPLSRPRTDIVSPEPIDIQVSFFAPMGQRFEIEQCADLLTGNWTSLTGLQTGAGAPLVYSEDPTGMERHFFRVTPHGAIDSESDGLDAFEEGLLGTSDEWTDSDGDGLPDAHEVGLGTDPANPDTDGDGAEDGKEVGGGYDPKNPNEHPPVWRGIQRSLYYAQYADAYEEIIWLSCEGNWPEAPSTYEENFPFIPYDTLDERLAQDVPFPELSELNNGTLSVWPPFIHFAASHVPASLNDDYANMDQGRYWLQVSPPLEEDYQRGGVIVTRRWYNAQLANETIEPFSVLIPAGETNSNPVDVITYLIHNGTDSQIHNEDVELEFLPVDVSFEKVGDNWEIEDNKDAEGHWMSGKGKRMFVDAKTPQESTMRDTVYVKVQSLPEGWKVRLKAFDVDDPTTDAIDPQHVIDSNDSSSIKQGNDNRGYDDLGFQQPPYFEANGDVTLECTVDSDGVAKIGGDMPKLVMTHHAGDNVRVAVIFLKTDGTPLDGQDLSMLHVNDSTQPGYVPGDSEQQASGFSGVLSPMLTVWRKLNVEVDSMQAVATSGSEKNFEEGVVQAVEAGPEPEQTIVTVDILLTGTADGYENGYLTLNETSYEVVSNTDNLLSDDQVVVKGTVPSSAINQTFTIVDDDDSYLAQIGLPAPLPRNQFHADVIAGIRSNFAPAYIQVEDANDLGWNPNQTIPFKLNAVVDSVTGSVFNNAKDLSDTEVFWGFTVTFGYQPETDGDHDPNTENFLLGGGSKNNIGNFSYGFAAIFMETIREDPRAIGDYSSVPPATLDDPTIQQQLREGYQNLILGVIAHEIGHSTGAQSEGQDHAEEGLMREGAGSVKGTDSDFAPSTINRFRNAQQWTH